MWKVITLLSFLCKKNIQINVSIDFSSSTSSAHDDILIEIYLNKPIQIGCIQLKLKFNKELNCPFELRLFRQKKLIDDDSNNVDSTIDFNLNNKYDVLFGPIDIRDYLDLTFKRTCVITICSNKLLDARTNLYFLSLKALRVSMF